MRFCVCAHKRQIDRKEEKTPVPKLNLGEKKKLGTGCCEYLMQLGKRISWLHHRHLLPDKEMDAALVGSFVIGDIRASETDDDRQNGYSANGTISQLPHLVRPLAHFIENSPLLHHSSRSWCRVDVVFTGLVPSMTFF